MRKIKKSVLLIIFMCITVSLIRAQSFSYSGPTTVTIPFGSSSTSATYYFSYSGLSGYIGAGLIIVVDGDIINNDLCHNPVLHSSYSISFTPGSHTVSFRLLCPDQGTLNCYDIVILQETNINVNANFKIRFENTFGGGQINVSGSNRTSPFDRTTSAGNYITMGAIDQTYNGNYYLWNTSGVNNSKWSRQPWNGTKADYSGSKNSSYTATSSDASTKFIAELRLRCNIDFENEHSGSESGGTIKVNSVTYTSPTSTFNFTELNPITAQAVNHSVNGIDFTFSNWSPGGSTLYTTTFYPDDHETYTANFTGRPNNTYRNQRFNSKVVGQPIKVYWDQHPNTNVTQYKVYRKPKYGSESCVGTIARTGTSSYVYTFTDPDMVHTNSSSSNDLYYYDVRAYYSPDGTYSDYDFKAVYAEMGGPIADDNSNEERMQIAEKTYEYGISNYPNPYNPTTTINYQIKEMGNVNITVFDALGRTVKVLVNDVKQPGEYNILFDGSNLSNGVYYYRMQAGNFVETKKMIMIK